jgi:hypothetical protein
MLTVKVVVLPARILAQACNHCRPCLLAIRQTTRCKASDAVQSIINPAGIKVCFYRPFIRVRCSRSRAEA